MKMTTIDNLTAVLHKKGDMRLEQRPIPVPKDNEVLVRIESVGICGTDVHLLAHGSVAGFIVEKPTVVGHEASGIVDKIGKNVKNLKPGDRVAIEPGVPCRTCTFCKTGKYNICPDLKLCSIPPTNGNLTRYYTHAADFCHKIPDNVSLDEAAVLEPLSVAVHACRRGNIQVGDIVLILGAGPIGLVTLLAAKAMGALNIVVVDIIDKKLEKAKELGATHIINSKINTNVKRHLLELLNDLPNKTMDCVGAEATIRLGIEVTRPGGSLVGIGLAADEVKIPIAYAFSREINIIGVFAYCHDYPIALELVASGNVNVKPLITHHYNLEETLEAFETARTGRGNAIKVLIHPK
ncbi:sorbitol dehydrogenase-like [Chrysoperla carnea]|uniref:sorbitol dehydrogenase-like n=1 Tax=Chrysoperla carnea TaxID=189513 RepID=UPI001D079903|nr:sorbitol dehydrogenase-like [Chrysoperla carnea]XP_044742438.1 sorbitol dehydrogenase-like [Chrysoperla carnea]XP_044742439.1 sorbitol dehydrogenase-like [Chrysoperla carnea]